MTFYELHPLVRPLFQGFINKAFEAHVNSDTWINEIKNQEWPYHSGLIDRGQTSFSKEINGLSVRDQVIIYCYYYMQMHAVSCFHVYRQALVKHRLSFLANLVFVDFGCGPITSAIAMAWYHLRFSADKPAAAKHGLRFHYIGIDRSGGMIDFAPEVWQAAGRLFHADSTCDIMKRNAATAAVPEKIEEYRRGRKKLTVCLNCSYYFGSKTLNVEALIKFIGDLLTTLKNDRVCLVFQNADNPYKNEKWEKFKAGIEQHLVPCYADECEGIIYEDVTGKREQRGGNHRIKLRHAVLLNHVWRDEREKTKSG